MLDERKTTRAMSNAELAEVLSQVRAGDTDAWGELYRRYAPAIFRPPELTLSVPEKGYTIR
jgi:hypothetical protein